MTTNPPQRPAGMSEITSPKLEEGEFLDLNGLSSKIYLAFMYLVLAFALQGHFSTFVVGFCLFLAGYFEPPLFGPLFMRLRTIF